MTAARGPHRIGRAFSYFALSLFAIIALYPISRIVTIALRPGDQLRGVTLNGLLVTQMFPATMLLLPLYLILIKLGLIKSYLGIIIYAATALPVGLRMFQANMSTQWGLYAAGALLVFIPVVLLFLALSRYLVSGLTAGAVKG